MTDVCRYEVHGDIAVITLDNPPVNGLSHALRLAISQSLRRAQDAEAVLGILIIGSASGFSGGADMREFGTPRALAEPTLRTLIGELEASTKPITAAIGVLAMGGGFELALGCHYRVAGAGARIALPEVKLGLLPGAGGTQRLPRLVGLERALEMIVTGDSARAGDLGDSPLFDRLIEGQLLDGALGFAREAASRRPLPRVRDRVVDHRDAQSFLAAARARISSSTPDLPAPMACVDALLASLGPFDAGLLKERALFTQLMQGPESAALRYAFFAERAAAKVADMPRGTKPRVIRSAAVAGAGTMGSGIASCFADAGIPVVVLEESEAALARGVGGMRRQYESALRRGELSQADLERRMGLVRATLDPREISAADVVVEAAVEDLGIKHNLFALLDAHAKPDAILASSTSAPDIDSLARVTRRPQDVLGLHFFSPANLMRLIEIVRGEQTSHETLATGVQLAKTLDKVGVVARVGAGFIGNRMLRPYLRQVELLLLEGCRPEQVDGALERWGWRAGRCRAQDLAGQDVLVLAPTAGISRRTIGADEIVTRCVYALINEGARLLEEGIAARASDIDVVYLLGYGFPRARGGPMFYADTVGLAPIVRTLEGLAAETRDDAEFWRPAPLLVRLAEEGKSFRDA